MPGELLGAAEAKRLELCERLADVDDEIADLFLAEEEITADVLRAAIRRATLSLSLTPVMMGSAFKNKGGLAPLTHLVPAPCTRALGARFALECRQFASIRLGTCTATRKPPTALLILQACILSSMASSRTCRRLPRWRILLST